MAIYHKTLQYHEDTTKKRSLDENDIKFLLELQKEMNTQDTTGTAEPRFWVIKGSKLVRDDECPTDFDVVADGECKGAGTKETVEYVNEHIFADLNDDEDYEMVIDDAGQLKIVSREDGEVFEYETLEEMNDFFFDIGWEDTHLVGYSKKPFVYPNAMFLTEKEAREHLERNYYHYSKDAHTYCMSAWRSPEVERLWKVLREVKWDELSEAYGETEKNETEKRKQTVLPVLKNNDQRREWLRKYKEWGLWYEDLNIGCRYYKYDFDNGARLIAETYTIPRNKNIPEKENCYFHLVGGPEAEKRNGVPKWNVRETYSKYPNSESELAEFLKSLQKGR